MAAGSRDISQMVFIRNVASHLENYSFDFEMLQVLDAVDGTRTVTEVADSLGKEVADLKATFDKLYKQGLVLSVQRKKAGGNSEPSPQSSKTAAAPTEEPDHPAPDDTEPLEVSEESFDSEETPPEDLSDEQEHLAADDQEDAFSSDELLGFDSGEAADPDPPDGPRHLELGSVDDDQIEQALNSRLDEIDEDVEADETDIAAEPVPEFTSDILSFENESRTSDSREETNDSGPDLERPDQSRSTSEQFPSHTESSTNIFDRSTGGTKGPGDFFSISKGAETSRDEVSSPFPTNGTQERSIGSDQPFSGILNPKSTNHSSPKKPALHEQKDGGVGNPKAIEHFEEGLEALQRKAYEEALLKFELANELDPENRLYKANLQRVRKILTPDS
ncbi:MAG: hypothetical protein ACOC0U_08555 [Desulfovibrionales bacterium]